MSQEVDVAIVGAGAAGIAAARRLSGEPLSLLLLEASQRIGGRAFTRMIGGIPLDMGCGWLHSADRNPLAKLAEAQGFTVDRTPPSWGVQAGQQGMSAAEQQSFGEVYGAWHERVLKAAAAGEDDRAASTWLEAGNRWNPLIDGLSSWINGARTADISAQDFAAYEQAAGDQNWRVPDGYGALIAGLAEGLPIALGAAVTAIDHNHLPVRLATTTGEVSARAVIVTVPSAVLAAEAIRLDPPIDATLEAAHDLPMGLADKLHLKIDEPEMFASDSHLFGRIDTSETGSYHLRPFGRPLIEAFFGGDHARELEKGGPAEFAAFAIDELASLIGSSIRRKLHLLNATAWCAEPLARGSYSHARPGHADARARLAEPVAGRLFFAGEACSAQDFSTAHGAWQSGIDAAGKVIEQLSVRS